MPNLLFREYQKKIKKKQKNGLRKKELAVI